MMMLWRTASVFAAQVVSKYGTGCVQSRTMDSAARSVMQLRACSAAASSSSSSTSSTLTASKLDMIKDLRARTGAPLNLVKSALEDAAYDIDAATSALATRSSPDKLRQASRIAAEGLVAVRTSLGSMEDGTMRCLAVMAELNCETDFVAKNERFVPLLEQFATAAMTASPGVTAEEDEQVESVQAIEVPEEIHAAADSVSAAVGEKISARRAIRVCAPQGGVIGTYVHRAGLSAGTPAGAGRIAAVVALNVKSDTGGGGGGGVASDAQALADELAMHVAGMRPRFVSPERAGAADVEDERVRIAANIESDENMKGKPQSVIDKVLEGRLRKSLAEVCLSEQKLVTQPDVSVREAVQTRAGGVYDILAFVRMEVGEGIARGNEKDFAKEVHEQVAKSRSS